MSSHQRRQRPSPTHHVPPASPRIHNGTAIASAPTTPTWKSSRSRSPAQRLSCAFSALKCSSRAIDDDPQRTPRTMENAEIPTDHNQGNIRAQTKFAMESAPLQSPSPFGSSHRPSGFVEDFESDGTVSVLLGLSTIADDHGPFEHFDGDGDGDRPASPRTPSSYGHRTAIDPPETPHVSNRDSSRPAYVSKKPTAITVPDSAFDELCQRNFNNTPKMWLQKGSLGDSITPLVSPEQTSSDEGYSTNSSPPTATRMDAQLYQELAIPSMNNLPPLPTRLRSEPTPRRSIESHASSVSQLCGEQIATELQYLVQRTPVIQSPPVVRTRDESPRPHIVENDEEPLPEVSSTSSVSSFVDISMGRDEPKRKYQDISSRPPFFWRSHPCVTVYSYNMQQTTQNDHFHSDVNEEETFYSNYTSFPNNRRSMGGLEQNSKNTDPSFGNPAAILHTLASFASNKLPTLFARSDK